LQNSKTKEVTPGLHYTAIVTQLLQELRSQLMPFLIAPYQAGSQLAYMSHLGYINLIITEDSTMVAHGAASILYKSVEELGNGQPKGILLQSSDIGSVSSLNLLDFSSVMLAVLCVALGCDYCDKLEGIGLVTASRIIRKAFLEPRSKETHPSALHVVLEELYKQSYTASFTDEFKQEYNQSFLAALLMYRHPIVFDPFAPACVTVALDKPDADLMDHPDYYKFAPACVTVGLDKPDADLMDHLDNYKFAPACVTVGLDEPDADLMDHLDYYKLVMDVNQRSLVIGIVPPAATATAMAEGQQFTSPNKTTTTTTTTTIMSSSDKEDAPVAAQQVEDLSSSEDDDLFQEPAEEEATTTSAKNEAHKWTALETAAEQARERWNGLHAAAAAIPAVAAANPAESTITDPNGNNKAATLNKKQQGALASAGATAGLHSIDVDGSGTTEDDLWNGNFEKLKAYGLLSIFEI
jgi:5'-3' exonuclease